MATHRRADRQRGGNRGIAAAEVALCLPAILLLFLGALECADMIYLKQAVAISAYEGARRAIQFDATSADVMARANAILAGRGVRDPSITITPSDVSAIPKGTRLSVTVSAPCVTNASPTLPLKFFAGRSMTYIATMVKE
jgi:Flp pilus assembly protein TadG